MNNRNWYSNTLGLKWTLQSKGQKCYKMIKNMKLMLGGSDFESR